MKKQFGQFVGLSIEICRWECSCSAGLSSPTGSRANGNQTASDLPGTLRSHLQDCVENGGCKNLVIILEGPFWRSIFAALKTSEVGRETSKNLWGPSRLRHFIKRLPHATLCELPNSVQQWLAIGRKETECEGSHWLSAWIPNTQPRSDDPTPYINLVLKEIMNENKKREHTEFFVLCFLHYCGLRPSQRLYKCCYKVETKNDIFKQGKTGIVYFYFTHNEFAYVKLCITLYHVAEKKFAFNP
jgi:hypothetical protein